MPERTFESEKQEFEQWLFDINSVDYDYAFLDDDEINISGLQMKFSSKNRLFIQLSEIVDYYIENDRFPKILFAFPFIMGGQRQSEFFAKVEKALMKEFKRVNGASQEDFMKDFSKSSIFVFGLRDNTTTLPRWVQSRMSFNKLHNKRSDWLTSYYKITHGVPVKKDVLSITDTSNNLCLSDDYEYISHGDSALCILKKIGFYLTIHSFIKEGKRIYTPYLFLDNIDINKVIPIIRIILKDIDKQNHDLAEEIVNLLNNVLNKDYRLDIYTQFTSLLICQVYLNHFINSSNIKGEFNIGDVAHNYGIENIDIILEQLVAHSFSDKTFNDILDYLDSLADTRKTKESSEEFFVRNIIFELGIDEAHYRKRLTHNDFCFKCDECETYLSINDFINKIKKNNLNVLWSIFFLLEHIKSKSCLLETTMERSTNFFSVRIHPNDLSLGILPFELSHYWQDFFRISQFYWRDDTFPEKIRDQFINDLFKNNMGEDETKVVGDAVYLAKMITENREVVDDMLNWGTIINIQLESAKSLEKKLTK